MATGKSQYLKPDPAVTSAAAADAFGGGGGNAELLIAANQARWSEHLEAANLSKVDQELTDELDVAEAESVAGVEFLTQSDGKPAVAVRGNYVVGVYATLDGRLDKAVLHYDRSDGSMERAEVEDTPALAALRAQIAAANEVEEAKREAQRIIADAQKKANEVSRQAHEDAQKARAEATAEAGESTDWSKAKKADLEKEAKKRGILDGVKGTGADGNVTAEDIRGAIQADDESKA